MVFSTNKIMKLKKVFTLLYLAFFCTSHFASAADGKWIKAPENAAQVRLIASFYKDSNGEKKLVAGLHFKLNDGWKIYGQGADNFGLPPSLDFKGSDNYDNHNIVWPKPELAKETFGEDSFEYSFYKHEIILPIDINLTNYKAGELKLKVDYGLCSDVCIPASQEFLLEISNKEDGDVLEEIQKFYPAKITEVKSTPPMKGLIYMTLLALLGGAILNIMPCVLPVLSIKLISVINHLDAKISNIRFAFLSTILGILSCFIALALIASTLKLGGNSFGWGFQFQNSYFLIFLIIILAIFTANLLGFFEINFDRFFTNFLNKKISKNEQEKNIFIPNFLSGILAVLLATPCSAPFLGSAISFGLTQKFSTIFIIFLAIGLGFCLPYLILLINPQMVYLLPKPGNWMVKIKKLMAALLAITILWLVFTLFDNSKANINQGWQEFNEEEIFHLVSEGKVVVVDITADWCITCKFNKIRVLQDPEVVDRFKSDNIVKMRGDITKPNEKIMSFLHKNDRFAIPFNAVYGPNAKNGLLTSELLNKKELLELINQAS